MWAYGFVAPFAVAFLLFSAWPIARTLTLGGGHYAAAASDPLLWLATANTLGFALLFALAQTPLALAAALLVDRLPRRLRTVAAGVFFSTHLVGASFAGVLFVAALSGRDGLVNAMLLKLGVIARPVLWLDSTALAMPVLVAVAAYVGFGFGTVYCLAALRRIDHDLLAAATVDGAGTLRRFWHVALPQLRPTLALLFVAAVFWGLQAFELPYVLFGGPGPGYRALTGAMYAFGLAFEQGRPGHAAAVSVLFGVAVVTLTLGLSAALRLGREEVRLG